jgi:RNA polymerase sigma-70 factor (ECF subfamily)
MLSNRESFERAYREHRAGALAAAQSVLHDRALAEEVVQDVFAQLWRRPRAFDERRGSLRGYIAMLARSRAIDRWRTQVVHEQAVGRLKAAAVEGHERSAAERAIERERSARVVSIVDRLPAPQREAILLTFGRGLAAPEAAEVIGVPPGTVKSRVRLGLDKLRLASDGVA